MKKILILLFALVLLSIVVSAVDTTVCCEKTTYGAWCQNAKPGSCDNSINPLTGDSYRVTPTSCDATSYCRQGCCFDSSEGLCMESTPLNVCTEKNGTWADSATCEIPQCQLGCCIIENQAAYVPLTRCKKISGFYNLQVDFRRNVNSEVACIAIAQSQDKGACVFEEDYITTCKFTTRADCDAMKNRVAGNVTSGNFEFHKDYLCSSTSLKTNCAKTKNTACIEGKEEVYFIDSCGNPANIYDSGKTDDNSYWDKIIQKKDSCGSSSLTGNAGSAGCGNCDYFSGSICKTYDRSKGDTKPSYGTAVCRDLNCKNTQDGNNYKHGESWCIYDAQTGNGKDPAGSRQWKHICIAGEEIVEPCGDFRTEVCYQVNAGTSEKPYQQAACIKNRWIDCVLQSSQKDCENTDKRDCMWMTGLVGQNLVAAQLEQNTVQNKVQNIISNTTMITGKSIFGLFGGDEEADVGKEKAIDVCVPNVPPGLKFWDEESVATCQLGSAICKVQYEFSLFASEKHMNETMEEGGKENCVENCECLEESWQTNREGMCKTMGDCTGSTGLWQSLSKGGFGVTGTGKAVSLNRALIGG